MDLIPVPGQVAHVAAAALDTRAHRGGGGSARGVVIATALTTGWIRPSELAELLAWHAAHPDDVRDGHSTLLGGLFGGAPAREAWPRTAAALNPEGTGAMVSLPVPPEVAKRVARDDGEPPDAMHVTLFHFGGNAADLDPGLRDTLGRIVGQVAAQTAAPALEMSHVERFTPGDKGLEPATLVDDSPDVYALRQTLQDALDAENVPYSDDHAFRAHMTIGYYPPGAGPDAGPLDEPEMWTPDAIEVHWGPDVDRYPLAGAENMPGNMPATAAASPTAMKLQRLSQRVNKTDRALVHRLHATANLALSEALRAAHVKLKTRIRNRTRTKQAALEAAAAERITPAILAAVGVTENDLLGHRFDTYGATAIALIAAAERRKLAAIAAALGLDADQLEEQYGPTIDARAAVASGFLVGALGEFARAALSGTSLTSTGPGEYAGPVPFGLIRNAWDAAATGATPPTISQAGVSPADVDQLSESSALGQDTQTLVAEILADQDVRVQLRSTWVHGDPDRPFPPHEALDGLSWVDTQPPELDNPDSFPETDVYQPGDHDGCTCWIDVQYEPYEGDSGNTTGETDASTLANAE